MKIKRIVRVEEASEFSPEEGIDPISSPNPRAAANLFLANCLDDMKKEPVKEPRKYQAILQLESGEQLLFYFSIINLGKASSS